MINLSPFETFLFSLSRISQIDYQIWDTAGEMTFSTGNGRWKPFPVKDFRNLSKRIVSREAFQYLSKDGQGYVCGIPLRDGNGVIGALVAAGSDSATPSGNSGDWGSTDTRAEEMKQFLGSISGLMEEKYAYEEELEGMAEELDQSFEDLNLYARIATQIKTLKFSSNMLRDLIGKILENMRVDMAFAVLPNRPVYDVCVTNTAFSEKVTDQQPFTRSLIQGIPQDAPSLEDKYFIINDSQENPQYKNLAAHPYRFLAVEVQYGKQYYGWLGLVSFNMEEVFRHGELKLLISLAEQLAVVIANTDLYEDLEKFIINMVKSLVFAIEAKDVYTKGHSERVSHYSIRIGEHMNLDKKEKRNLRWASILHDVGKIGIPESILNKPGRLTGDEFEIIKEHPVKGAKILEPVEQLSGSLPGIIHHHERYDGQGYPKGLKGDAIPLVARIIAVADTFDAISSDRAYRSAEDPEKAMAIVNEVAGSQLDADIVEVFTKVYKEEAKNAGEK